MSSPSKKSVFSDARGKAARDAALGQVVRRKIESLCWLLERARRRRVGPSLPALSAQSKKSPGLRFENVPHLPISEIYC